MKIDLSLVTDVVVDNIDPKDAPDYSDAFIASATYAGRDMTDQEIELLNTDSSFVYEKLLNQLY